MEFSTIAEMIIAFFLVAGGIFALIGSFGLAKLPDYYMRLHGPTKASTLGVGGMLIGSTIYFSLTDKLSLHEVLITFFLFATAPISAHLLIKAGIHAKIHEHATGKEPGPRDAAS